MIKKVLALVLSVSMLITPMFAFAETSKSTENTTSDGNSNASIEIYTAIDGDLDNKQLVKTIPVDTVDTPNPIITTTSDNEQYGSGIHIDVPDLGSDYSFLRWEIVDGDVTEETEHYVDNDDTGENTKEITEQKVFYSPTSIESLSEKWNIISDEMFGLQEGYVTYYRYGDSKNKTTPNKLKLVAVYEKKNDTSPVVEMYKTFGDGNELVSSVWLDKNNPNIALDSLAVSENENGYKLAYYEILEGEVSKQITQCSTMECLEAPKERPTSGIKSIDIYQKGDKLQNIEFSSVIKSRVSNCRWSGETTDYYAGNVNKGDRKPLKLLAVYEKVDNYKMCNFPKVTYIENNNVVNAFENNVFYENDDPLDPRNNQFTWQFDFDKVYEKSNRIDGRKPVSITITKGAITKVVETEKKGNKTTDTTVYKIGDTIPVDELRNGTVRNNDTEITSTFIYGDTTSDYCYSEIQFNVNTEKSPEHDVGEYYGNNLQPPKVTYYWYNESGKLEEIGNTDNQEGYNGEIWQEPPTKKGWTFKGWQIKEGNITEIDRVVLRPTCSDLHRFRNLVVTVLNKCDMIPQLIKERVVEDGVTITDTPYQKEHYYMAGDVSRYSGEQEKEVKLVAVYEKVGKDGKKEIDYTNSECEVGESIEPPNGGTAIEPEPPTDEPKTPPTDTDNPKQEEPKQKEPKNEQSKNDEFTKKTDVTKTQNEPVDTQQKGDEPQTGDTTDIILYVLSGGICLFAVICLLAEKNKKSKNNKNDNV